LDTQNNSLTIDLSEEEDLDDRLRDYWTDTIVRPKQVIYWPNFVARRRRHNFGLVDDRVYLVRS